MKERPIIFSAEEVIATLEGRKTQFRRPIKSAVSHDPWYREYIWSVRDKNGVWHDYTDEAFKDKCPYGKVGDRLIVCQSIPDEPRITLEIKDVRVERVQDITLYDVELVSGYEIENGNQEFWDIAIEDFSKYWDSIYKEKGYGWDEDPWVWVVEFERIENEQGD